MGSRKPSIKDLVDDTTFKALLNSQEPTTGRSCISSKSISSLMTEKRPLALEPSVDVVIKARAAHMEATRRNRLAVNDSVVDVSEMGMVLGAVRNQNRTFRHKVNQDASGILLSVYVIMSSAAAVLEAGYKILGIDGAHCKDLEVGEDGEILSKSHIISLSTRGPGNKMILLAFALIKSENAADITALIEFACQEGIDFNWADFTLFLDRGAALLAVASTALTKPFKFLCSEHLKRNLISNGFSSDIVKFFTKAVHSHSAREFDKSITAIKEADEVVAHYLEGLPYAWSVRHAIEKGMVLYGMTTNNVAEQISAWKVLTPSASKQYWENFQSYHTMKTKVVMEGPGSYLIGQNYENQMLAKHSRVDLNANSCDCGKWLKFKQPCVCAIAALITLEQSDIFNSSFFGPELLTITWRKLHEHETMRPRFPGDNEVMALSPTTPTIQMVAHLADAYQVHSKKRLTSVGETDT